MCYPAVRLASENCYSANEQMRAPESPIRSESSGSVVGGDPVTLTVLLKTNCTFHQTRRVPRQKGG